MPVDGAPGATAAGTFMATGNSRETDRESSPVIGQPHATDRGILLSFHLQALHPRAGQSVLG